MGDNRMKQLVTIGIGNKKRVSVGGRHELFTHIVACSLKGVLFKTEASPFIIQPVKEINVVSGKRQFDGTLCNSVAV